MNEFETLFADSLSLSQMVNEESTEFIPLMTEDDEDKMHEEQVPQILPILPLRNTVLFPGVVIPITVGRDKSVKLIKDANSGDKVIGVVSQKDGNVEDPEFEDLNTGGTSGEGACRIFCLGGKHEGYGPQNHQGISKYSFRCILCH